MIEAIFKNRLNKAYNTMEWEIKTRKNNINYKALTYIRELFEKIVRIM